MMSKSKRVGVISYNSVIRDARILKEADSIASNGFDVHIFGLADNNTPSDYEKVRKSGAKITLLEKPEGIQRYDKLVSNSLKIVKRIIQAITYLVYVFLSYLIISNVDAKIIIFGTMISFPILFKKRRAIRNIVTKSVNTLSNKIHSYIKSLTFGYREKVLKKYRQQSLVEAASNFEFDIIHCHDMMTLDVGVEIKKVKVLILSGMLMKYMRMLLKQAMLRNNSIKRFFNKTKSMWIVSSQLMIVLLIFIKKIIQNCQKLT
ncbi:hypothetical protein [Vibrio proteolyticus]|uniref:Glycosyltransferase n=1 Tax=Vibrio proteolyticus NBRC 13287 TaxID=1219065 RepID=U2ZFX2_VIBPR|nr:hypothetical protein [Vibrio proteolyticus]GAD66591.1 hypothetical protein VPR01S_04_01960 [Vibrio proteolyticus NBRC 13287]